jgi:hypothetical protein
VPSGSSSGKLALLCSDEPPFSTNGEVVSPRACARDDSNCVMQSSSCDLLCRYTTVTVAKSAQARSSRKSGRAIGRRRRDGIKYVQSRLQPKSPKVRLIFGLSQQPSLWNTKSHKICLRVLDDTILLARGAELHQLHPQGPDPPIPPWSSCRRLRGATFGSKRPALS